MPYYPPFFISLKIISGEENYNAVALSTAGNDGRVSSRMVLLKGRDSRGFVFFSNYESRKGDNRLHHRTEYTLHNSVWHIRRLAP